MSELKEKLMESIKKDEVKMRSKTFFKVMKALIEITIIGISLSVIFLINLSFYLPRKGPGIGLGINRWNHILSIVPWGFVILGAIGTGLLIWILYRYTGAYKKRLVWVISIVTFFVVIIGFLLSVSNFNETVGKRFRRMDGSGPGRGGSYHLNRN